MDKLIKLTEEKFSFAPLIISHFPNPIFAGMILEFVVVHPEYELFVPLVTNICREVFFSRFICAEMRELMCFLVLKKCADLDEARMIIQNYLDKSMIPERPRSTGLFLLYEKAREESLSEPEILIRIKNYSDRQIANWGITRIERDKVLFSFTGVAELFQSPVETMSDFLTFHRNFLDVVERIRYFTSFRLMAWN